VLSQSIAEQIAFEIQRQIKDSSAFAFLQADQVIFYSRENTSQPPFARSPVVNLIQAVYDFNPEHARRILRSRIFSTVDPSEMCLGMTKVSAKRLTAPIVPVNHGIDAPFRFQELLPILPPPLLEFDILTAESRQLIFEKRFMKSVIQIAQEIPKQAELYHSDRAVAAILISSSGEMLALARNSNAKNRTRHAEINLVQGFVAKYSRKIPAGSQIFVTLKCCKMCAAAIWHCSEDPYSLQIFYDQDDPGPNARVTVFTPGSFERKRVASSAQQVMAETESQITAHI
jgi:tRNA(Arg) A34 adenosine deaminase TadA